MSLIPSNEQIRQFVLNDILRTPDVEISDSQELLLSGVLDSISVIRLISFVEEFAGIVVPPEDLLPENFGSFDLIQRYLSS